MSLKRKHTQLTINNKLDIIKYYEENMRLRETRDCRLFQFEVHLPWQVEINRRTLSDIINNAEKWKNNEINICRKRMKMPKHMLLDKTLLIWFNQYREMNGVITDDILRSKAKEIGDTLDIQDFTYSTGYIQRFKKRNKIKCIVLHC